MAGKKHGHGKFDFAPSSDTTQHFCALLLPASTACCLLTRHSPDEGDFCHDWFHGLGSYCFENGARYTGMWANNQRHGHVSRVGRTFDGMRAHYFCLLLSRVCKPSRMAEHTRAIGGTGRSMAKERIDGLLVQVMSASTSHAFSVARAFRTLTPRHPAQGSMGGRRAARSRSSS